MTPRLCFRHTCLLLVIFLFPFQNSGAVQSGRLGGARGKKRASSPPVAQEVAEAPKPQLLNADTNPTLRYPVCVEEDPSSSPPGAHFMFAAPARPPAISCGWLDVTRAGISYLVVMGGGASRPRGGRKFVSPGGVHYQGAPTVEELAGEEVGGGFEASSSEIGSAQMVKGALMIYASGSRVFLAYSPQSQWGDTQTQRALFEFAQQNLAGTMAIQRAMQNFDTVLVEVKPPAPAPLDVSLRAEPPMVEKGRPVTLVWNSTNATSLDLEPGVGRVAAAGGMSLLPQDSTNYTLTATGPAGVKASSVYVTVTAPVPAAIPTLVLTEPSAAEGQTVEVTNSPLTINGVVMDASGMPIVTVNGRSVTMRPTSAQAAQFRSDPMDLQPGENKFEVVAVNSAHGQAKVTFIAHLNSARPKAQPAEPGNSKGLGKAEILSLLTGDVPSDRVTILIKERGIKFAPTPDDLREIRGAGGGDDLLDAINQAAASTTK